MSLYHNFAHTGLFGLCVDSLSTIISPILGFFENVFYTKPRTGEIMVAIILNDKSIAT